MIRTLFMVLMFASPQIQTYASGEDFCKTQCKTNGASLVQLLVRPQSLVDKKVTVTGYLSPNLRLYLSKELSQLAGGDFVPLTDELAQIESSCYPGGYAKVTGRVQLTSMGYSMTEVSSIFLLEKGRCLPE